MPMGTLYNLMVSKIRQIKRFITVIILMGFETHKQDKTNVVARLVLANFYFLKASSKGLKIKLVFLNNGISKNFKSLYVYMVLALKKRFYRYNAVSKTV